MPRVNEKRDADIVRARAEGDTLSVIGERYGITRERVRQILAEYGERDNELWTRLDAIAREAGFDSNSATRAYRVMTGTHLMRVGRLDSDEYAMVPFVEIPPERWHEIPNCGDKALAVIGEAVRTLA